jgi:hypothetical protein
MEYELQNFVKELDSIILELEHELVNREKGIPGDGTVEQLILFIDELKKIRDMAILNSLPPKKQRRTAFSWHIVDSWNHDSQLGDRLCEIADKYKRKLS